ncbi:DNA polymerase III subunit delta' [Timonella sp. A28]|uniref:DNA polymerase III subunit delta' n=1 Tax=Timonella sp. A28 TaxID=3442640 RepID=UPI003EBBD451
MSVWDELVGQEAVINTLKGAVNDPSAMTHAWLLTGPPGSGRSNAARAFAAALQCEQGGCGTCQSCLTVLRGTHPDVTVIATEKVTIAIDEVRGLITEAARTPSAGRWRVILIEDADRMLERTTNVLLKAIEEPAPRTVWLLCAPSPQDVMVTIRSRCRKVSLRIPPVDDVARLLEERDGIDPHTAQIAARAAQSHIGLARRYARDEEARARRNEVLQLATHIRGVSDAVIAAGQLVDVAQTEAKAASAERDAHERAELMRTLGAEPGQTLPPALRSQMKQLEDDQKRRATRHQRDVLDQAMLDLLSLYRDVLITQLRTETPLVNVEHETFIFDLAARSSAVDTLAKLEAISSARKRLSGNVAPLLAVEAMMVALRPASH